MSEKKQSTEGLPMFVEPLMTPEEWNTRLKEYPSSSKSWDEVNKNKTNPFKWRHGMGKSLSQEEISNTIRNLDYIKEKAGLEP